MLLYLASPYRTAEGIDSRFRLCSDWTSLLAAAARHQTLTLLAMALHGLELLDAIPAPFSDRLRQVRQAAVIADLSKTQNTADLLDRFQRRGIRTMLLKGQGIAERVHLEPSERYSADIDFLVQPGDVEPAGEVLEEAGYRPFHAEVFRNLHFHIPYFSPDQPTRPPVELHWDVAYPDGSIRFNTGAWWEKATTRQLRAGEVLLPPPEEELVYLAFHALNRGIITLRTVSDVARLRALTFESLNWDRIFAYAAETGTIAFFNVVHQLAEEFWPVPHIALPPLSNWQSALKLRIASNLLAPATVLRTGCDVWWPYKRITYWAVLPGNSADRSTLFSLKSRLLHEIHDGEVEAGAAQSYPGFMARILAGLLLCLMPGKLFPSTRDQVLLMARRGGFPAPAGGDGTP
ncbi:MAG: nucleotidyltransferase family protein [Acidobacteria bacterium]|uniref:Nucleotidyltransferase family protein n=1 Tax=Candidatus Polarisedimenticola svalbardensis TaxID=2886004 RepID=A0A8J6Y9G0_9BACT|nr:nucleotidyltransferase family protein [Candidatus Polarisedimenticola svalbardensis]